MVAFWKAILVYVFKKSARVRAEVGVQVEIQVILGIEIRVGVLLPLVETPTSWSLSVKRVVIKTILYT